jgi:DNA-binding PadR family transcriptional regulator
MPAALSSLELFTLVAIARLGDAAYGVTIRDDIQKCAGRTVSVPAVYAALDRLERRGFVRRWLSDPLPERGGRARRHYELTASGSQYLERERASAMRMWGGVPLTGGGRR